MVIIVSFILGSHSYSNVSFAAQNPIVSTTTGDNSLIDAIKQYSNITEADVNKYKLLWLGWFGAVPALVMGGASMYGGYEATNMLFSSEKARMAFGFMRIPFDFIGNQIGSLSLFPEKKKILRQFETPLPETGKSSVGMVSDFLKTRMPWMAAAAIGAGFLSYKLLYPRIRQGVLNKVQNFIDVCSRLTFAMQKVGQESSTWGEWANEEPLNICLALDNLKRQAYYATTLLNQVGANDNEISKMKANISKYIVNLQFNSGGCGSIFAQIEDQRGRSLQQQGLESQIFGQKIQNVKNVVSIVQKVGSGIFNFARDVANFGIQNKEPLGLLGAGYWLYKTFYPTPSVAR